MQVVDREQQRLLGREVEREPVQAVQRRERGGALLVGRERLLEQRGGRGGRAREPAAGDDPGLEQLAHDAVGELALELPGPRLQDLERRPRTLAQAGEQPGLADAGRPLDQHEAAAARGRVRDQRVELRELRVALEQEG